MGQDVHDDNRGDGVREAAGQELDSRYFVDGAEMRRRLNAVSPSMCLAKWFQVSIHLPTGRTQSCYHPPTHPIPLSEIAANPSALHNTRHKMEQRRLMKEGVRPAECQYCWNIEDAKGDHLSDRHYRSGDPWAADGLKEVVANPWDYDVKPRYVEVNFNHACQFKCSYCSPYISSSWMEEVLKEGSYPLTEGHHNDLGWVKEQGLMPIRQTEPNPYADAFWNWWPEMYKELRVFRMTGGEPLIDANTYRVFDYVIEHPKPDLILSLTSNLCPRKELFDKFIDKAKRIADGKLVNHLQLFASVDSWGAQAEYIRHGMKFDTFLGNVDRYLSEVESGSISFIVTFNSLSVVGFKRLVEGILELRARHSKSKEKIWFDTPMLHSPAWQSIQTLPPRYREIVRESIDFMKRSVETKENRYLGIKDFEIARMERVLAWMEQSMNPAHLRRARANFHHFFSEHDRRRGTNFQETFPEMADFWELCRDAALSERN